MHFNEILEIIAHSDGGSGTKPGARSPPTPVLLCLILPLRSGGAVSPARGSLPLPSLF